MSDRIDYLRLFDATPTPYLILNAELQIVAVNDAYLNATMTRREEILGRGSSTYSLTTPAIPTRPVCGTSARRSRARC